MILTALERSKLYYTDLIRLFQSNICATVHTTNVHVCASVGIRVKQAKRDRHILGIQ